MIASFGGTIIDSSGNRITPAAGGRVGSNDITGVGYAWIAGAGKSYYSFTPDGGQYLIPAPDYPQYPQLPNPSEYPQMPRQPPVEQIPTEIPTPIPPTTNTPTDTPTNTPPTNTPTTPEDPILTTVRNLFSGLMPKGLTSTPLYVYNPPQSGGNVQQASPILAILVIGGLGIAGYFVYQKFKQ